MNNFGSICFICLNNNTNLKPVLHNETQNDTAIQVKYVIPEITILDGVSICSLCCNSLQSFYTFKKQCLDNYNRLMNQTEDKIIEINIKEETEEVIISDTEVNYSPEFVKCEIVSDGQNGESSDDNFDPFDLSNQTKICKGLKKFKCLICNNKFTEKGNLQKHMRIHAGIKDFECSICKKQFTLKGHLQRHIKTHTGEKDYECTICKKRFTQNVSLQMHIKTHDGVKNFECSVCSKKFTLKSYLQKHMRFHVGIRRFECSVCYKKFTLKCHLQAHMKTHTGIKDFQCHMCNKSFSQSNNLHKHMKVHLEETTVCNNIENI